MNKKEIKSKIAHARQQAEQKSRKEISDLKQLVLALKAENQQLTTQNRVLKEQIHEMEYQLMIDKDWLERMQDYVNLSDDDMQEIRRQIEAGKKGREALDHMTELTQLLQNLGGFGLY